MTHGIAILVNDAKASLGSFLSPREMRRLTLAQCVADGLTAKEAAERAGVSVYVAYAFASSRGLRFAKSKAPRGPKPDTAPQKINARWEAVVAARAAGKSLEEIGQQFGVTRERIRQILVKAGGDPLPFHRHNHRKCRVCGTPVARFEGLFAGVGRCVCSEACKAVWKASSKNERLQWWLTGKRAARAVAALRMRAQGIAWGGIAQANGYSQPQAVMDAQRFAQRTGVDCSWAFTGVGHYGSRHVVPPPPEFWEHHVFKAVAEANGQ